MRFRTRSDHIDWTPRLDRTSPRFQQRLAMARLTKKDLAEIVALYEMLDAELAAEHLPSADRVSWQPIDILEWHEFNDVQKYLDLKTYARASDRIMGVGPLSRAA